MNDVVLPDLTALPKGFVWGAATAAFQIEGDAQGRGDSIWDQMCREPGRIIDGSNGLVACDHVHHVDEDVALLNRLGANAYRFSISWPRVIPGGRGAPSEAGLAFYDRLVDTLLAAGVEPWITLYHWDLPTELHKEFGGWAGRDIVDLFTEYSLAVHTRLGDRARRWTTLNEPWCSAWLGYGAGIHAPGIRDYAAAARVHHHLLLAHGRAVAAMRAQAPADHEFGIVLNLTNVRPAEGISPDATPAFAAALRAMDGVHNRSFLEPIFRGEYPADVVELHGAALTEAIHEGDLDEIAVPIDFLGVNYYSDSVQVPSDEVLAPGISPYPVSTGAAPAPAGEGETTMGWPVTPDGLRALLVGIRTEYPDAPGLYVTENGSAYLDDASALSPEGYLEDPPRVDYLIKHLAALNQAAAEGADVRGYFAWSLLDNFEWALGYTQRFGLVRVDYDTQARTPKRTFEVYSRAIASQV